MCRPARMLGAVFSGTLTFFRTASLSRRHMGRMAHG